MPDRPIRPVRSGLSSALSAIPAPAPDLLPALLRSLLLPLLPLLPLLSLLACTQPADTGAADLGASADQGAAPADLLPFHAPLRELRSSDVSIVYPLPPARDIVHLIGGSTLGKYGRLVPLAAFSQIAYPLDPRPTSTVSGVGMAAWLNLRLVGLRLDPCTGSRGDIPEASCRGQVRLVFQGVRPQDTGSAGDDGAIHVLYDVPRPELGLLMRDLLDLTESEGGYTPGPLGVHPILLRQGVWGSFAQRLKTLLLAHLGEERVTRLTFFVRADSLFSAWRFGLFDRSGTGFSAQFIATTRFMEQQLLTKIPGMAGDLEGSTPTPTNDPDNLTILLSGTVARAVDDAARQRALTAALRIENPLRHSPDTIDCLSCHVAMATRTFGEQRLGLSSQGNPDLFTSTQDLRFTMPAQPSLENIHALSYMGTELGINQRTANDSAVVAQAMTALLRQVAGQ